MYKLLSSNIEDDNYISLSLEDRNHSMLVKTAAKRDLPKEVDEAIKGMVRKPNHAYILVTAMGDGETWGANKNGDFFPNDALLGAQNAPVWGVSPDKDERLDSVVAPKLRYKTFEDAHYFKHHKNKFGKDPHFGYVERAIWHPKMRTVLLIIGVDRKAAPDTAAKIDANELVSVSMGAKLPWDRCSICGSKHKTIMQYCHHLKFSMGKILPDGKRVYAENLFPRFFDISEVTKPAFLAGLQLEKIANLNNAFEFSLDLAQQYDIGRNDVFFNKQAESEKHAVLYKEMPAHVEGAIARVCDSEQDLPIGLLNDLAKMPPREAWGALTRAGIIAKPNEFAYVLLKNAGREDLAENFVRRKAVVHKAEIKGLDEKLHELADIEITHGSKLIANGIPGGVLNERCIGKLSDRIYESEKGIRKEAGITGMIGLGGILSALYLLYRKNAERKFSAHGLLGASANSMRHDEAPSPKYIGNDPYLVDSLNKEAGFWGGTFRAAGGFAVPYVGSAYFENKMANGERVGAVGRFIANNPGKLGIIGAAGAMNPKGLYNASKTLASDTVAGAKKIFS